VVDINLANTAPKNLPLHGSIQGADYSAVIQQGRYLLWGFEAGPSAMTPDGVSLFLNLAWHLLVALEKDTLVLTDPARFSTPATALRMWQI